MAPRPGGRSRPKQHVFHLSDREWVEISVETTLSRSFESTGHLVVDQCSPADLAKRESAECATRIFAHPVVARTAYSEVAFFELAGEGEDLLKHAAAYYDRLYDRPTDSDETVHRVDRMYTTRPVPTNMSSTTP